MRKVKLIFLLAIFFLFVSCSGQQPLYVRNIKIDSLDDKYNVIFEFYDFSSQEENFQTKEYTDADLEKLCIKAINENNFNFRLLENLCITPQLLTDDINLIFYVMNSIRIPVTTNIVCFMGDEFFNDKTDFISTCLYNFSLNKGNVDGLMSIYDKSGGYNGGLIVSEGEIVKYLDENHWKVLNLLIGNNPGFTFTFRDGHMSARLECCNVYFHGKEEINIELTARLKDYNGISDTLLYKDMLLDFLESELENTVYQLYNDVVVSKECNLMWYGEYKNINSNKIYVNISVL